MATYTNLHLAISNKLGWGDMLASVAMPAIDRIINNYVNIQSEIYGITAEDIWEDGEFSEGIKKDILNVPADYLFGYLYISSINNCYNKELCNMFRSLRWEIEQEMFHGASYQEAIDEWFK